MKKLLYILSGLIVLIVVLVCLTSREIKEPPVARATNMVSEPQMETKMSPNIPTKVPRPPTSIGTNEITESTNEPINALMATNLEQWKILIKGLHKSPSLSENWNMEITNRMTGVPILLQEDGQTVSYKVRFINISINNDGSIMEIEMHSPIMNIDETRELGLQLCNLLQIDPKGFLTWCDQVGNRWMDQPLFGDGDGHHHYSFHLLQTFDNEKPWYINFIIQNP